MQAVSYNSLRVERETDTQWFLSVFPTVSHVAIHAVIVLSIVSVRNEAHKFHFGPKLWKVST